MNFAAEASGATLGYIVGNVPGAIIGYNAAKKLSKNSRRMPPIPNKRKRTVNAEQIKRARRKLVGQLRRPNVPKYVAVNTQAPKVTGGSRRTKKVKPVKVTKRFRKQVQKVLEKTLVQGKLISIEPFQQRVQADNLQSVIFYGEHFTPNLVLDAASVLWNQKPWNLSKTPQAATNFNHQTVKIHVKSILDRYEIKNNSRRRYTIKMYICRPKDRSNETSPLSTWVNTLLAESDAIESNFHGTNINTMYNDPRFVKGFTNVWATEVVTIVIDPGQTHTQYLQGPKNMLYDFAKFNVNNAPATFLDQQPFTRWVMCAVYPDLVSTTTGSVGRYIDATPSETYDGLVIELKRDYNLSMPEQAGLPLPAVYTPGATSLDLRRYAFAIYNNVLGQTGSVRRIDEENPVTVETDT